MPNPVPRVSAADLRKAQRAHERAGKRYDETTKQRNALVAAALAEGWTHARVSEATGLSRGRIGQIAESWKREGVPYGVPADREGSKPE